MHILLITHHYEPEIGAPQRRWSALVQRWRDMGHEVTVCCPPPHYPDRASSQGLRTRANRPLRRQTGRHGETIIRMPYMLHGYASKARAVDQFLTAGATVAYIAATEYPRRLAGRGRFDAVISTVPGLPSLFAGVVVSKLLKVAHVAEMRDAWPDVVTGELLHYVGEIPWKRLLFKKFVFSVVTAGQRSADAVVTTTPWFSEKLRARGMAQVAMMTNGADPHRFGEIPPLTAEQMKSRESGSLKLQYLGTVGRSQGLMVLIDALKLVRERAPHLKIKTQIVGAGAHRDLLRREAATHHLDIEFIDPIGSEGLRQAYEWAEVELVSLRRTQPFRWTIPSKIFEILATRRWIVALVEGDAAEVVRRSGVGSVVEPENAEALADELQRLAENPSELVVGDSGVELLHSTYNYDLMSAKYEALLSSLVRDRQAVRDAAGVTGGVA